MPNRYLELTNISAKDLKNVNHITKMDVYAVVSVHGDQQNQSSFKTPVDKSSGSNPMWNFSVKFTVSQSLAESNRLLLGIKLMSSRVLGHKVVGEVNIPVKDLLDSSRVKQSVTYQVRKASGKPKGTFSFSYNFSDIVFDNPGQLVPASNGINIQGGPGYPYHNGYNYLKPCIGYPPPPSAPPDYGSGYGYPQTNPHYYGPGPGPGPLGYADTNTWGYWHH